jgi:threonine dehydrogenase-like Zn-dependent dehydrogenase
VQALVFRYSLPRLAAGRILGSIWTGGFFGPWSSFRLEQVPDPTLLGPDWLILRTVRCGICGSDSKQVFMRGDRDNPMTALISFPHILGHEAAGVVDEAGSAVTKFKRGDRVVINPWLSCAPRGIEPPCPSCQAGDYPLCERFTEGRLAPGIHNGNCVDAPGGFAERIAIHESQAFAIPDGVDWDAAALADPFSVALHTVLRHPPPEGRPALVYGSGTLGLLTLAILRHLHPGVPVWAVARYPHQQELARRFGVNELLPEQETPLVERVAGFSGAKPLRPWQGAPWLISGAGIVYDTVGSPGSVEASLRVCDQRAKIVVSGVEAPRRFEWTPLYFKEAEIIGSNAFGVEDFEGRRLHGMQVYFELLARGFDVSSIVTHRYPLGQYRDAMMSIHNRRQTGSVKVMFTFD